jgi:hypothetical protein
MSQTLFSFICRTVQFSPAKPSSLRIGANRRYRPADPAGARFSAPRKRRLTTRAVCTLQLSRRSESRHEKHAFSSGWSRFRPAWEWLELKGKAPVSKDALKIKLPKPREADLPNGIHLMVLEDHRLPQISVQVIIPGAGGYFDTAGKLRLAEYTA